MLCKRLFDICQLLPIFCSFLSFIFLCLQSVGVFEDLFPWASSVLPISSALTLLLISKAPIALGVALSVHSCSVIFCHLWLLSSKIVCYTSPSAGWEAAMVHTCIASCCRQAQLKVSWLCHSQSTWPCLDSNTVLFSFKFTNYLLQQAGHFAWSELQKWVRRGILSSEVYLSSFKVRTSSFSVLPCVLNLAQLIGQTQQKKVV